MSQVASRQEILDLDKLILLFRETREQFKETKEQFKDTDRKFQDTDRKFQDTDRKFQETKEMIAQTHRETQKELNKLLKKISETESRWGRFVESLVEGALIKLLNKHGIIVSDTAMREKTLFQNKIIEIDIIARNGLEVVAVEVKTTLSPKDVANFIEKLKLLKKAFPRYSENNIYGAVAYISKEGDADIMAEKKGLLVIKATGESARIANSKNFKPKIW